jgi:acetyl-CoA carboxylase/biotin carboxylase 1
MSYPLLYGNKLHQVFQVTRTSLENILAGYILPDPHFNKKLVQTVETLMKILKDPSLPLLELQVGVLSNTLFRFYELEISSK